MSRSARLTPENREAFNEADYSKGQFQENQKELEQAVRYRRLVIENDDPECEAAVSALEKGWSKEHDR